MWNRLEIINRGRVNSKNCTLYIIHVHPQLRITFPASYLLNVCNVFTTLLTKMFLQLWKVSKNLAYPGLKYPNNVQLSQHDIHNIQKLVFVGFCSDHYCILYTQIYNSAILLYTVSVFLNIFLVKNEVVIADRLVVSRMLNKFIPLLLLSHIWLIYWVTANGRSADTHVFSPGGFSHNWQLTNVWTLTHVWRRDKNRNIKEGMRKMRSLMCVCVFIKWISNGHWIESLLVATERFNNIDLTMG